MTDIAEQDSNVATTAQVDTPMTITALDSTNVKRLKAVSIDAAGKSAVIVGGRNEQGKSSVLDSIIYCLGGKPDIPEPIRQGEDNAEISIETDRLIIVRRFTPSGTSLTVSRKFDDGTVAKLSKPQAVLDELLGDLSFDPLGFIRKSAKEQAQTLRDISGVDTRELDQRRATVYATRTDDNRKLRELDAQLANMLSVSADTPDDEISLSDLIAEISSLEDEHAKLATCRQQITALEAEREEIRQREIRITESLASFNGMVSEIGEPADVQQLRDKLANAESTNRAVRAKQARTQLGCSRDAAALVVQAKTDQLDAVDHDKATMLANATMPVDGLAVDGDVITYNKVPMEQCSSAQQLYVAVAMGIAANPTLRVILIHDGSLLDSAHLQMITEMATQAGAQVWIERVSDDGDGCTVIIEDGEVAQPVA